MLERVRKVNELTEELMGMVMTKMDKSSIMNMDVEDFKMTQIAIKLLEASTELMEATARTMERTEKKIDMLLERTGEES